MNLTGMHQLSDLIAEGAIPFCRYHPKYHAKTVYDYPVASSNCQICWLMWYSCVARTLPPKDLERWLDGFSETVAKMAMLEEHGLLPDPSTMLPRVDVVDK